MITTKYKAFFDEKFKVVAKKIIEWGISPNQLTLIGLAFGFLSCLFLVLTRNWFLFTFMIIASGVLDAVDGLVARLTQRTTKFGSYLDAMCDRYFESFVVVAVAYVTGYWLLSGLVMMGCLIISYAKARAGLEVPVSNTEWPDFMERTERDVVFIAGLFFSKMIPVKIFDHDLFFWTLVFLTCATHFTVIQRMLRAKNLIETRTVVS